MDKKLIFTDHTKDSVLVSEILVPHFICRLWRHNANDFFDVEIIDCDEDFYHYHHFDGYGPAFDFFLFESFKLIHGISADDLLTSSIRD